MTHDWRRTDHNNSLTVRMAHNYHASRNESYVCLNCGLKAGRHYLSHRKGWVATKNFNKPCDQNQQRRLF